MYLHRVKMFVPTLVQASGLAIMAGGALLLLGTAGAEIDIATALANIGAPINFDPFGIGPESEWIYYLGIGLLLYATGDWMYVRFSRTL